MTKFFQNRSLQNLSSETWDFARNPGLMAVTSVIVILLLLFVVFPIGSILLKSFTVRFPTVTVRCQNNISSRGDSEKLVTQPILAALQSIEGIVQIRTTTTEKSSVVVLRFRNEWDDLRGLDDAKRALKKVTIMLDPFVEKIKYELGEERIKSFATYVEFFSKSYYYRALINSIILAIVTTILVVFIGFCFAYLGIRGPSFIKKPLRTLVLIPLIGPPFIFSLSLILVGGRHGIITELFHLPFNIYGFQGVVIAQTLTFLPLGYLMIDNVLRSIGSSFDDVASDMGASDVEILFRITIPLAIPGILKGSLLVFIMSIADFGNPMIIGGGVSFLATDTYMLWVSENYREMAAVFCVFLIIPSMIIFIINEYSLKGRMYTTVAGKPEQVEERKVSPKIYYSMMAITTPVLLIIVICFGLIFIGAFTKLWMIDNSFTLEHFQAHTGITTLKTSLEFAFFTALIAPIIGVPLSYILMRKRIPLKRAVESIALLGFAVPGTVMGVGYILIFNTPPLKLTGTLVIMVINEAFRNISVSLEAGISKLHQLEIAIEEAAMDMGATTFQTFVRIVVPLISSAVAAGFIYTFMVSLITVSAVIFLYTPGNFLAAIYILRVAEGGVPSLACAMSVLLIIIVFACLGALKLLLKYTKTRIF